MRIALTGPESSGKTQLAIALAQHFGCKYIPEFARFHLQEKQGSYEREDLLEMATQQNVWMQQQEAWIIYDSDILVFQVWNEVRFATCSLEIERLRQQQPVDFTLLCAPDIPWTYDPLREDPKNRGELFERYRELLLARKVPHAVVTGIRETRLQNAISAVESYSKGAL